MRPSEDSVPVSVIIMTKNEEAVIEQSLESVKNFDEVFVVDSNSTDQTRAIADRRGAIVVDFTWDGAYPKKKEWSLLNIPFRNDWVLYLDADEIVTPELAREIATAVIRSSPAVGAYDVGLRYYFSNRELRHGHSVSKRILVRRSRTVWPRFDDLSIKNMWEVEGHYQPTITGRVIRLKSLLEHRDRDLLFDYFERHNKYSDWEAYIQTQSEVARSVRSSRTRNGQLFRKIPLKPVAFFVYAFVLKLGFLDGRAGLDFAIAQAFYYWQIDVKSRELRTSAATKETS